MVEGRTVPNGRLERPGPTPAASMPAGRQIVAAQ
jgi:hypothetical protein